MGSGVKKFSKQLEDRRIPLQRKSYSTLGLEQAALPSMPAAPYLASRDLRNPSPRRRACSIGRDPWGQELWLGLSCRADQRSPA